MADRLSIKWVEGNTNATSAIVASDTTFNVDQPTMWTPLSVLSGLASGYCERRAVLDNQFVDTISGTTYTWDQTSEDSTAAGVRAAVVQNCMHNLAKGSSVEHLFDTADATMSCIGVAGGTNYMTAMNGAIAAIIGATVTYTDINGATFTSASLSAAASAAAAADSSSYTAGITAAAFALALPAEWAKEKKWMLDQLRYMGAVTDKAGTETYTHYSSGVVASRTAKTITMDTTTATNTGSSFTQVVSAYGSGAITFSPIPVKLTATCTSHSDVTSDLSSAAFSVYFTFAPDASIDESTLDYVANNMQYISSSVTATGTTAYCVVHGGTLSINSANSYPSAVVVESGGCLAILHSAVRIPKLYLFDGAVITPVVVGSSAYKYADNIYYNFEVPLNNVLTEAATCTYISGGTTGFPSNTSRLIVTGGALVKITGPSADAGNRAIHVSGGSLAIDGLDWNSAASAIQLLNGEVTVASGAIVGQIEIWENGRLTIDGGSASDTSASRIRVHSGGTVTITGAGGNIYIGRLDAYDGATVQVNRGAYATSALLSSGYLNAYHHCTFGLFGNVSMAADTVAGWVTVKGRLETGSTYILGGPMSVANISSYISNSTSGFADMSTRIHGSCYVGATEYASVEDMFAAKAKDSLILHYGARIAAKNRTAPDYYPSFYVRQHKVAGDPPDQST